MNLMLCVCVSCHQFAHAFSSLCFPLDHCQEHRATSTAGKMLSPKILTLVLFFASFVRGLMPKAKIAVVRNHNKYRASVEPSAGDMLNMVSKFAGILYFQCPAFLIFSRRSFKYVAECMRTLTTRSFNMELTQLE
jgi:hypothetical protein